MYRVTTPEHVFTLPEDSSAYSVIQIAYKQRSKKLIKTCRGDDVPTGVVINGNTITVDLTQEETKNFGTGEGFVQIRVLTTGGKAYASKMFPFEIEEVISEEILKP